VKRAGVILPLIIYERFLSLSKGDPLPPGATWLPLPRGGLGGVIVVILNEVKNLGFVIFPLLEGG